MPKAWSPDPGLYTKFLVYIALQVAVLSFLAHRYDFGLNHVTAWAVEQLDEIRKTSQSREETTDQPLELDLKAIDPARGQLYNVEQLALFDGTRASRPVYLAILGRVYDVQKGHKHYGPGGGYHFFAGKDATRAFVTGDFTEEGLIDDVSGLSSEDLLGIRDWVSFYDKDYKLVGVVAGRYYDNDGEPTEELMDVLARIESAVDMKNSRAAEAEVFPPCNSEWHQNSGGRVWCSTKSGGIHRDWAGVPRILSEGANGHERCVCVKNFGPGLSKQAAQGANRGDLDHPALKVYKNCSPTANSCKLDRE